MRDFKSVCQPTFRVYPKSQNGPEDFLREAMEQWRRLFQQPKPKPGNAPFVR